MLAHKETPGRGTMLAHKETSLAHSPRNSWSFTYSVTVPTLCSGRESTKCCPYLP